MNNGDRRGDLLVLVADLDMEQTIKGLLARPKSLDMAPVKFDVRRHPNRDSGCRSGAVEYLRAFLCSYSYALVMFDLHGSGSHRAREETQWEIEEVLSRNGWRRRAKAIVIEPELEAWVWNASNHVPRALGWDNNYDELKQWLEDIDCWPPDAPKPSDPKEAMRAALREKKRRVSSALFGRLAKSVTLRGCEDPAFTEFTDTLRSWFPPEFK